MALADTEARLRWTKARSGVIDALLAQGGFGAAVALRFNREQDSALAGTINK